MNVILKIVPIDNIFIAVWLVSYIVTLMRNPKYCLRLHLTFMNNLSISEARMIDVIVL